MSKEERIHVHIPLDTKEVAEYVLSETLRISHRRLMYGEWLAAECVECKSRENVHLYRVNDIHPKITVHLCDTCFQATPIASHIREWEPGDE